MKQNDIIVGHVYANKNNTSYRLVKDCTFPNECNEDLLFVIDVFPENGCFKNIGIGLPYHILRKSFSKWAHKDVTEINIESLF